MKTNHMILIALFMVASLRGMGQEQMVMQQAVTPASGGRPVRSLPIEVSREQTSNLIFPYPIVSVDRGSGKLLAQIPAKVENVLQLKATSPFEKKTNLTVITSEGGFYPFVVSYSPYPVNLNLRFALQEKGNPPVQLASGRDEGILQGLAQEVSHKTGRPGKKDKAYQVSMQWSGCFIGRDRIFVRLELENKSKIPFEVSQLRFFCKEKQTAKRTAVQEIDMLPEVMYGKAGGIASESSQTLVAVFPKFTLPDEQRLHIQLMERGGGRHLELKIPARVLSEVKSINSYLH